MNFKIKTLPKLTISPILPPYRTDTMRMPFNLASGATQDSPMMYLHAKKEGAPVHGAVVPARLSAAAGGAEVPCVAVKMAYQGGAYSAVIAMPHGELEEPVQGGPARTCLTLEGGIDYTAALEACRGELLARLAAPQGMPWREVGHPQMKAIKAYLPRFEVEAGASLGDALKAAGLTAPFRAGDFTRVAASAGDLEVSDVVHKVYVKVDEEGTEAAAVTAVIMMKSAMWPPPAELFVRFDRPFVFSIVHEHTGMALFVGEVGRPEQWKD